MGLYEFSRTFAANRDKSKASLAKLSSRDFPGICGSNACHRHHLHVSSLSTHSKHFNCLFAGGYSAGEYAWTLPCHSGLIGGLSLLRFFPCSSTVCVYYQSY